MDAVQITVNGVPAPQGSKKAIATGAKVIVLEMSKNLEPWRAAVTAAGKAAMGGRVPLDTAISTRRGVPVNAVGLDVVVKFRLQRPASVRRQYPSVMPDLDKLIRSTGDALKTAGVYTDDSRVVGITAVKVYADTPGADITVREAVFP